VLPIVVLPSPVGLGNLLAPALISLVLGDVPVELAVIAGLVMLAALAWFVVGGLAAATLEAESARLVAHAFEATGDAVPATRADGTVLARPRRVATRILAARLVAHILTGLVLVWGSVRLIDVAYRELTAPFDVATPIVLRVLREAPEAIAAILVCWAIGEVVGGLAARRITFDGLEVLAALRGALVAVARRPLAVAAEFLVPLAALVVVLLPSTVAASAAWNLVRAALRPTGDPFSATLAVLLFVSLWLVGLLLIAVTAAWRSAVWSLADRGRSSPGRRSVDPMGSEPV